MSNQQANEKLRILLTEAVGHANRMQEGHDMEQALTIAFAAAGVLLGCSTKPCAFESIMMAARTAYKLGMATQIVISGPEVRSYGCRCEHGVEGEHDAKCIVYQRPKPKRAVVGP